VVTGLTAAKDTSVGHAQWGAQLWGVILGAVGMIGMVVTVVVELVKHG
jgi:hypothetical protein